MNPKVLNGIKFVLKGIAGIGITLLCSGLAGNIAGTTNSGAIKKACMAIGGAVIGAMVAQQAETYIDGEVDKGVEMVNNIVTATEKLSTVINEE